jgi:hypothetical protein
VPLIQVLDAARAWGEARLAYYRTVYAQHESVFELVTAQGEDILTVLPATHGSSGANGDAKPPR